MHPSSQTNVEQARKYITVPTGYSLLDVGGRKESYKSLFSDAGTYDIANIEQHPEVNVLMAHEYTIPRGDSAYDLVVSGQCLEHVRNPFKLVAEMKRVLKPGCFMILTAPSIGPAHDKVDCWRFMRDAFAALADDVGLELIKSWIYTGDNGGGRGRKWDDHTFVGRKP